MRIHHVSVIVADVQRSLEFYQQVLGLSIDQGRPALPYDGAWLGVGDQQIHLMQLPNPDPLTGRPEHGGRDRHLAMSCADLEPVINQLQQRQMPFTRSKSGRAAIFFRDPDGNAIELIQAD